MNYPAALDDGTSLPSTRVAGDTIPSTDNNNKSLAIIAVETKVGTGASTPTASTVLRGTGAGTSAFGKVVLTTDVTGVLPIANIATGTPTGSKFVRDDGTLQAIAGGGDALVANPLSQFAATTSAQLATVLTDETGTGANVFAISPALTTPDLGTPSALVATNATGTAASLTAGTATAANGLKSATTTVAVSAATAPTSGQVLTATGGSAATWQTPSAGGGTSIFNTLECPCYTSSAYQTPNSAGSATVAYDSRRQLYATGATSSSYIQNFIDWTSNGGADIWAGTTYFAANINNPIDGSDFDEFIGVGNVVASGSGITDLTPNHYGFHRKQTASGGVVLTATCADGTTETSTTLTDWGSGGRNRIAAIKTASTVKFYVDQVLVATHSTHVPTSGTTTAFPFNVVISNKGTTASSQFVVHNFSFSMQEA